MVRKDSHINYLSLWTQQETWPNNEFCEQCALAFGSGKERGEGIPQRGMWPGWRLPGAGTSGSKAPPSWVPESWHWVQTQVQTYITFLPLFRRSFPIKQKGGNEQNGHVGCVHSEETLPQIKKGLSFAKSFGLEFPSLSASCRNWQHLYQ